MAPAPKSPVPEVTQPSNPLIGRRLGRYEMLLELASGGMATVFVARSQGVAGFERFVALKLLHAHLANEEEFVSMFLDEARLAARIHHPNVVATLDVDMSDEFGLFLVMDYIEGHHLGAVLGNAIRAGTPMPPDIAARVVVEALRGLAAAHDLRDDDGNLLNIVHRDISPHNILVGSDGSARLTDFGVAKAEVRIASTRAGQIKGKLAYMAPEQASEGTADQRSDVFAMGIVLFEALTSSRLFRAANNAETIRKVLIDPIPVPSALNPALAPFDACVAKALERDPARRYESASDFADALEEAAMASCGLASTRAVAGFVRAVVGEKIDRERSRIRAATLELPIAPTSGVRIPIPSTATPSMPHAAIAAASTQTAVRITGLDRSPLGGSPSSIIPLPQGSAPPLAGEPSGGAQVVVVGPSETKLHVILVTALILVAGMAGVAGYFANRAAQPRENRVVAPATPTPTPSAEVVTAAVPAPPVAPPTTATVPAAPSTTVAELPQSVPSRPRPTSGMRERPDDNRTGTSTAATGATPDTNASSTSAPPVVEQPRDIRIVPNPYTGLTE